MKGWQKRQPLSLYMVDKLTSRTVRSRMVFFVVIRNALAGIHDCPAESAERYSGKRKVPHQVGERDGFLIAVLFIQGGCLSHIELPQVHVQYIPLSFFCCVHGEDVHIGVTLHRGVRSIVSDFIRNFRRSYAERDARRTPRVRIP
nr:MAG TPA: hypothetical protein [Caudoviricetes sp.]